MKPVKAQTEILARINRMRAIRGEPAAKLEANGETCVRVTFEGSEKWVIDVECPDYLSLKLPIVCLVEPPHKLLAHVAHYGTVCINDEQGISIDRSQREMVIAQVAMDAIALLESSAQDAKNGYAEFFNEYEGYWSALPGAKHGWSDIEVNKSPRLLCGFYKQKNGHEPSWFIVETNAKSYPPEFNTYGLQDILGIYVAPSKIVLPPNRAQFLSLEYLEEVISRFDAGEMASWEKLLRSRSSKNGRVCFMALSYERQAGGRSLIGVTFHIKNGKLNRDVKPLPISIERHSADYMRERGGAHLVNTSKSIAVLGCGSVGSEIADALAASGVGKIILVDLDVLGVENVFRHLLGRDQLGQAKVFAVKRELERKYPGIKVQANFESAQKWLHTEECLHVDGIIIAIGMPTTERHLFHAMREIRIQKPIVNVWLEPLDLGGHAVALNAAEEHCLDCLYRNDEDQHSLYPRISFLAQGQKVSKNLTGCASIFTPYGAIQSRRTALLAAELMIDILSGEATPQYRFSRGEGKQAELQGLKTTNWFKSARTADAHEISRHLFATACETCRKKNE